jgi:hypothetical protein
VIHPHVRSALAEAHARDLRASAGPWRWPSALRRLRRRRATMLRPGPPLPEVRIRWAFADDSPALVRLAAGAGDDPPRSPVLLAEVDGRVGAALSLCDGRAIASSAGAGVEALDLLEVRASQLGPTSRATAPHWRVPA